MDGLSPREFSFPQNYFCVLEKEHSKGQIPSSQKYHSLSASNSEYTTIMSKQQQFSTEYN